MRGRWRLVVLARTVRVLRLHPGDTLLVTYPSQLTPGQAWLVQRQLEDQVGYRNDVEIVVLDGDPTIGVVREAS